MATQYATLTDFGNYGIPAAGLGSITPANITAALAAASERADGYLSAQYTLPLTKWGTDLTECVCAIAVWVVMTGSRGYDPEGSDNLIRTRYDDAIKWLEGIAAERISPPSLVDSTPALREGAPAVVTGANGNLIGPGGAGGNGWMTGIPYQPNAYPYAYGAGTTGNGGRRGW